MSSSALFFYSIMKQTRLFLLVALLLSAITSWAQDFEVDGIFYNITSETNKTVEVTYKTNYDSIEKTYSGFVTIPSSVNYQGTTYLVTAIGKNAFSQNQVTKVNIPNSVTSIGESAFYSCSNLTSVTIPNSVTYIGSSALSSCSSLKEIIISCVDENDFAKFISRQDINSLLPTKIYQAYVSPRSINRKILVNGEIQTNIVIPNGVTSIGEYVFAGCSGLTSVIIPNDVISIGNNAFVDCYDLTSVTIPNSVEYIGSNAFGFSSMSMPQSNINEVRIACLDDKDFRKYLSRTDIQTTFHYGSLYGKKHVILMNGEEYTDIVIPSNVTSIGDYAFRDCSGITSVTIANNVTSIGSYAFYGCKGLQTVTIPNNVTSIGSYAFQDCSSVRELSIGDGIQKITGSTFMNCSSINKLYIGNGVGEIEDNAFVYATGIKEIHMASTTPPLCSSANVFYSNIYEVSTLYVPQNAKSRYREASVWKDFGNIVTEGGDNVDDTVVKGDMNGDGKVTMEDVNIVLNIYLTQQSERKELSFKDWESTNAGQNNSTSSNTYEFKGTKGDVVSFDWRVSSEAKYDYLAVTCNGEEVLNKSGEDFGSYSYTIPSDGTYSFVVTYSKDKGDSSGSDKAWIKNFKVTPMR